MGDWGLGIGPNPQSPIPNPQSPIPNPHFLFLISINKQVKYYFDNYLIIYDLILSINLKKEIQLLSKL